MHTVTLPLAAASERLKGKPGRPKTRLERPPAPVVQVASVGQLVPRLLDVRGRRSTSRWPITREELIQLAALMRKAQRTPPGAEARA